MIRTVALPVVSVAPEPDELPPRLRVLLCPLPLEPKMSELFSVVPDFWFSFCFRELSRKKDRR